MRAALVDLEAKGIDCVTVLTPYTAGALKAAGYSFACRYLGSIGPGELGAILGEGMGVMPVTYADQFDGPSAVKELLALGIPAGVTVWLDVESVNEDAATVIAKIEAWGAAIEAGGWTPGLYVGAAQPLNGSQLYALKHIHAYWRSGSIVPGVADVDFQLFQTRPMGRVVCGVQVDVDVAWADCAGRRCSMVVA